MQKEVLSRDERYIKHEGKRSYNRKTNDRGKELRGSQEEFPSYPFPLCLVLHLDDKELQAHLKDYEAKLFPH